MSSSDESTDIKISHIKISQALVAEGATGVHIEVHPPAPTAPAPLRLRTEFPQPDLDPGNPYPLLTPFARADQLGGRDGELAHLLRRLTGSTPLLAVFAPSGYGKSSFLLAGLLPRLRSAEVPAVMHRQPDAPDLGHALIQGLLLDTVPRFAELSDFEAWLDRIRAVTASAPVFVLDQFEDVFKLPEAASLAARRRLGRLLAATIRAGSTGVPLCRWVLAYRQEFHGDVERWLADVFVGEAPPEGLNGTLLPTEPWAWPLPALRDFRDAIERPLAPFADLDPPWRFADGAAEALATAFTAARAARPEAPLVPELQVVLGERVQAAQDRLLTVPDDADTLVEDALRRHLLDVLKEHFQDRTERTLAVLALRRLADAEGRADARGLTTADLSQTLAAPLLDRLAAPHTRLLLQLPGEDGQRWRLSHDRLAEIIARLDDATLFQGAVDAELVQLDRRIGQRAAQFKETGDPATLSLPRKDARRIATLGGRLLWDTARRTWWQASRARARRRRWTAVGIALTVALIGTGATWLALDARHQALVDKGFTQLQAADAQAGESVLVELGELLALGAPDERIDAFLNEKRPWEAAWATPARDVEAARRRLIAVLLPRAITAAEHGHLVAGTEVGRDPETPGHWSDAEYGEVRDALHARLVEKFGPPPAESEVPWRLIPAGSFRMGHDMFPDEKPIHEVHITRPFELMRHEVTRKLYARFDPISQAAADDGQPGMRQAAEAWGADQHPMWAVTWYEAWAFAAWLHPRSRLPTEAEWEYAARGGTTTEYWTGDSESDLDDAGWWKNNGGGQPHEVCEKQGAEGGKKHPFDLCDIAGNLSEWTADRWDSGVAYPGEAPRTDPAERRRGALRSVRGGSFLYDAVYARSANRNAYAPTSRFPDIGFRVVR